jgi:hypothetical protein
MDGVLPQIEVGGRVFSFKKIPVTQSMRVVVPGLRAIMPALFRMGEAMAPIAEKAQKAQKAADDEAAPPPDGSAAARPSPDDVKDQIGAIEPALMSLLAALEPEQLVKLQVIVFGSVLCKGRPIVGEAGINETFGGDLAAFSRVFMEALKENYADFFPANLSRSVRAIAERLKKSSPPISTGSSSPPS